MTESKIPSVFISYSWDNKEHQNWVYNLVKLLREKGIDANFDQTISQSKTVNFYTMMIENIHNNDFVVIVLTKEYAKKANKYQGGVGYETIQLQPLIQENLDKIVCVSYSEDLSKVLPNYLKGTKIYNLGKNSFIEEFEKLYYHLHKEDYFELPEIGEKPVFKKKTDIKNNQFTVPNLKRYSEQDRADFLKEGLEILKSNLVNAMVSVKMQNTNFDFDLEESSDRFIITLKVDAILIKKIQLWISYTLMASDGAIYISDVTNSYSFRNNNSFNKWVKCRLGIDNELEVDYTSFDFGNKEISSWEDVSIDIWKTDILPYLR